MKWPDNKDFAFTIIDDTDDAVLENIEPLYGFLLQQNIRITKTIWVYPSRDHFIGESLENEDYVRFLKKLKSDGFEIQLHNVGSGTFNREEILAGIELFNDKLGYYPSMQINHAKNPDNIYWGYKKYGPILKLLVRLLNDPKRHFYGDEENSQHFWGDVTKKHIKYIRNREFWGINTLKFDPKMPYIEDSKPFSNYWFSCSTGDDVEKFNKLISRKNISNLIKQKGLCIAYAHLGDRFVDENGLINAEFKEKMGYLRQQNGWFAPAGEILDYLLSKKKSERSTTAYQNILDLKFLINKLRRKYSV